MSETTVVALVPEPIAVTGISQAQYDRQAAFRDDLERNLPQILAVLPKGVRAEALAAASMTAALDNPKLLDCSPVSMMRAVLKMATLGLRIGETCDLVPIGSKVECWVRVKGVVDLAVRAGAIRWAREGFVCEGDHFEHEERGEGTHFVHRAHATPKADGSNLTHVYAIVVLKDGTRVFEVWSIDRVLEHKKRHAKDTKPGSVWDKHPLPMMAKSVVKAALRFAPLSPDVRGVMAAGDDIGDGTFEVVSDPSRALASMAGAMDALALLDDGTDTPAPEPMTLADAEAMTLPGNDKAWGGHGGKRLAECKDSLLTSVVAWIGKDAERAAKFAALAVACEIVMAARQDDDASAEMGAAA